MRWFTLSVPNLPRNTTKAAWKQIHRWLRMTAKRIDEALR